MPCTYSTYATHSWDLPYFLNLYYLSSVSLPVLFFRSFLFVPFPSPPSLLFCVLISHDSSNLTLPSYFWLNTSQYGGNRQSSEEPEHLLALRGVTESVYPPMAARMISGALQGRCVCVRERVCVLNVCVCGCVCLCVYVWGGGCVCMYACVLVWAFTYCCVWNLGSWSTQQQIKLPHTSKTTVPPSINFNMTILGF